MQLQVAYMHARAIHNALTQDRTVRKGGSNPPNPPAGHILSRIYNCTKHGNRPIDNATLYISILQPHKL